jgi:hypothetical protein
MKLDQAQAREFLEALYRPFFSKFRDPAYLEVRGKREGEGMTFRRFYRTPEALLKDMARWRPGLNYWIGVALRRDVKGGKKENLLSLTVSFCDVDVGVAGHKGATRYQTKDEARAAIEQFPLRPYLLVDSGGGFQSYWLFRESVELTQESIPRLERINRGLAQALGGDVAATDAARILRLPGTFNMKIPGKPRPVKIIWCEPDRVYDLADLGKYEAKSQGPSPESRSVHQGPGAPGEYEAYAQKALADELAKLAGTPEGSHDRNNQLNQSAFALGQLVGAGVLDRGSVEAALYGVAVSIGLTETETRDTIRSGVEAGIRQPRQLPERERPRSALRSESRPAQEATKPEPALTETSTGLPTWPQEGMAGAAGRFAASYSAYLETPQPFLYMSYLTFLGHIISSRITLKSEITPQPRLFTILLGESADVRKTTSISKTHGFYQEVISPDDLNTIWGVGSAEGLAKCFKNNSRAILVLDELKSLIQKMRIDASVLLPCINTLFESKHFHSLTKKHDISINDAELCLLAASTLETYRNMFTATFMDIGFLNRLFIVIGDSERKFSIPDSMPEGARNILKSGLKEVLDFVGQISTDGCYAMPVNSTARDIFDDWYFNLESSVFSKRLDTYGHRLMPLLAVNEMLDIITPEIAEKTVALLNYQLEARKFADPIDADSAIARLEERIRRLLASGPLSKRDLERRGNKNRVGIWIWNQAIKNLRNSGEIFWDSKNKEFRLNG